MPEAHDYLGPEAQARLEIDKQLTAAGWIVQRHRQMNLGAGRGVAVREFPMAHGHGDAEDLLARWFDAGHAWKPSTRIGYDCDVRSKCDVRAMCAAPIANLRLCSLDLA